MPIRLTSRWMALLAIALTALALGACGDDEDDSSGSSGGAQETTATQETAGGESGGSTMLEIDAVEGGGGFSFSEERLTAKPGEVTITMRNPQGNQAPHAVEIEGNGIEEAGDTVQPGSDTSTATASLKPGEYVFYCPVGNHRDAGMEGTLTVR